MKGLPEDMSDTHKSTIENTVLRAGMMSDYIEDIRPASMEYEHETSSGGGDHTRNVIAKEVQFNIDPDSELDTGRVFFRLVANVGTDGELVHWIRIMDGPNRFVAQGEHSMHKERVSSLARGLDNYLEENY